MAFPQRVVILSAAKDPEGSSISTALASFLRMDPKHGYIYIVGSNTGTLYIGVTSNLGQRILQHKRGEGSDFTARYGCHRLLYFERFEDIRSAISREKSLKGKTRAKKLALVQAQNPEYRDLAVTWGWLRIGSQQSIAQTEAWLQVHPEFDPARKDNGEKK